MRKYTWNAFLSRAKTLEKHLYSVVAPDTNKPFSWTDTELNFKCVRHSSFIATASQFFNRKVICKKYSVHGNLPWTTFITRAKKHNHITIVSDEPEYFSYQQSNLTFTCPTHGNFDTTGESFIKRQRGCDKCVGKKPVSWSEFLKRAEKHKPVSVITPEPTIFEYMKSELEFECSSHGRFTTIGSTFVNSVNGCNECGSNISVSWNELIKRCKKHQDITLVSHKPNKFVFGLSKLQFNCENHGPFVSTGESFIKRKHRCPEYSSRHTASWNRFVDLMASKKHIRFDRNKPKNFIYDSTIISFMCDRHGPYALSLKQAALNKYECRECRQKNKKNVVNWDKFTDIAKQHSYIIPEKEPNKFVYSSTDILFKCTTHGEFRTTAQDMIRSPLGCIRCGRIVSCDEFTERSKT